MTNTDSTIKPEADAVLGADMASRIENLDEWAHHLLAAHEATAAIVGGRLGG